MSDFDAYLTDEDKSILLQRKIAQFAAEGYQHELNLKLAQDTNNEELLTQSNQSIDAIKSIIAYFEGLLAEVPVVATETAETSDSKK
jgi:hypothetical protein